MTLCGLCLQRFKKKKSLSHWQIKRLNWCIFVGTFSNSFKSFFFFFPNNLVQSPSLRTDLYLQILTAKDNLSSTMGVISGGFVCDDSNFFFLRDKHKWITIMTEQIGKIRYFFLFEAVLYFSFFTGWVPASRFNAQLMANDRCIKWSWDFNGHLSLAVKGRLQKSCWELLQQPSVCQMDSFLPSAAHFLPSFSLTRFVFFQLNYILI